MQQYLEHARFILSDSHSVYKPNRTGIDTISRFGHRNEYDLQQGFPLLTTKKMHLKSVIHELVWFLHGDSNIKYLVDNDVHIWDGNAFDHYLKQTQQQDKYVRYSDSWHGALCDYIAKIKEDAAFAQEHGDLGPVYGWQWRHWRTSDGKEIDQLEQVVELLHRNPQSRRMIITAWNPEEVPQMALPPCHALYQFNVADGTLDCQLYQRSCDMFLGVPFNVASYALLTHIMAQEASLKLGTFSHVFGDAHFYCGSGLRGEFYGGNLRELKRQVHIAQKPEHYLWVKEWIEKKAPAEPEGRELQDHIPLILLQLSRELKPLPHLKITPKRFDQLQFDDFTLEGYESHPGIRAAMAV